MDISPEQDSRLQEIFDTITEWCSDTKLIKDVEKNKSSSFGGKLELLKIIFGSAKIEYTNSNRKVSTKIEDKKLKDLIFEVNKIFDYLKDQSGKDIVIIIDDLEKIPFEKARDFFITGANFIRALRCRMLLTIPIELVYHRDYALIQGVFEEAEVLPMIKVKNAKGEEYREGIDILKKIISRRIDLSLFEDNCYEKALKYSGGSIRDLFRILYRAALIETKNNITKKSMDDSINNNRIPYESKIQESRSGDIKFREYLAILFDIYKGNKTAPDKNIALLDLLRFRAVMKYNGNGFYDTHPLLDNFIEDYLKKQKDEK